MTLVFPSHRGAEFFVDPLLPLPADDAVGAVSVARFSTM